MTGLVVEQVEQAKTKNTVASIKMWRFAKRAKQKKEEEEDRLLDTCTCDCGKTMHVGATRRSNALKITPVNFQVYNELQDPLAEFLTQTFRTQQIFGRILRFKRGNRQVRRLMRVTTLVHTNTHKYWILVENATWPTYTASQPTELIDRLDEIYLGINKEEQVKKMRHYARRPGNKKSERSESDDEPEEENVGLVVIKVFFGDRSPAEMNRFNPKQKRQFSFDTPTQGASKSRKRWGGSRGDENDELDLDFEKLSVGNEDSDNDEDIQRRFGRLGLQSNRDGKDQKRSNTELESDGDQDTDPDVLSLPKDPAHAGYLQRLKLVALRFGYYLQNAPISQLTTEFLFYPTELVKDRQGVDEDSMTRSNYAFSQMDAFREERPLDHASVPSDLSWYIQ